jgi:ankyrin repeat protein
MRKLFNIVGTLLFIGYAIKYSIKFAVGHDLDPLQTTYIGIGISFAGTVAMLIYATAGVMANNPRVLLRILCSLIPFSFTIMGLLSIEDVKSHMEFSPPAAETSSQKYVNYDDDLNKARTDLSPGINKEMARNELRRLAIPVSEDSLYQAIKGQYYEAVTLLLKAGVNPNFTTIDGQTPLTMAASFGDTQSVSLLLAAGADIDTKDSYDRTALMYAVHDGYGKVAEILLAAAADPNIQHNDGATALTYASQEGHTDIVKALIAVGADPQHKTEGRNAAWFAAVNNHVESLKLLVNTGADLHSADENEMTALMHASVKGYTDVVKILLNANANPDIQRGDGGTALMLASINGQAQVVRLLLAAGADINLKYNGTKTAIMFAQEQQHNEIVMLLQDASAR